MSTPFSDYSMKPAASFNQVTIIIIEHKKCNKIAFRTKIEKKETLICTLPQLHRLKIAL